MDRNLIKNSDAKIISALIAVACMALVVAGLMLLKRPAAKPLAVANLETNRIARAAENEQPGDIPLPGVAPLNAKEKPCVGTWAFMSPDKVKTRIVYTFDRDRRVREEHYHLSSATPNVPRITMLGQWRVEKGRLLVEPASGLTGLADQVNGTAREALDDDERIPRPILGRIYPLREVTTNQLIVTSSDASGKLFTEIIMNRVK